MKPTTARTAARASSSELAGPQPRSNKSPEPETFTTGEMARLSNTTLRTVRFYEEAGILQPTGRTDGGHRVFERSQLDRMMWISDMREAGMSLDQIRTLLDMKAQARSGGDAAKSAQAALATHIEELRTKIGVLTRLSEDLAQTLDATSACVACDDTSLFPNKCHACGRLEGQEPLPRGMRVLWSVRNKQAGEPPPER